MALNTNLAAGKAQCYAKGNTGKIWIDSKTGQPTKLIFAIMVDTPEGPVEHADWMSLDMENFTTKGTPYIQFTFDALKMMGALQPEKDILAALDSGVVDVSFAWRDGAAEWTECRIEQKGNFTNIKYGAGAAVDTSKTKSAGDRMRAMLRSAGAPVPGMAPAANPFASPTRTPAGGGYSRAPSSPISPPAVQRAPVTPPRAPAPVTPFDDPAESFPR